MLKDPRDRLFHCLYGKKDREKMRRKVPNPNAVEVIVCFFFNPSTIVQNLFSFNVFYDLFCLWKTLSVLPSASTKIFGIVLIKCIIRANAGPPRLSQ